jgi:hypothetical protein
MASLIAFPPKSAIHPPTRSDANPFRNGADLNAGPEIDEERYRNRANLLAAVVAVLLITAGWWIMNSLVETQKVQGCFTSGTRYCSSI